ncbi:universal stress protein [Aliiroseovarius sp. S1339]|uniref:universal stress protein n=1 Tax=Aliiroseovarius sp. S1339 TaxID=2936990 RepID=UPI0020BE2FA5|nr:universal stress protein [Aliiroseovarius sp. S1339]MCK8463793.1 universal stress protein [Aliiroseovarius sp. S1339]
MFKKILSPVDLAHADKLEKALAVTGELARSYGAEVCFVGVTGPTPSELARNPKEYAKQLAKFAAEQGTKLGVATSSHMIVSTDPAVQMNQELEAAVDKIGADLVVMATHPPGVSDYFWSGHGAHLAAHSDASVMLIRG